MLYCTHFLNWYQSFFALASISIAASISCCCRWLSSIDHVNILCSERASTLRTGWPGSFLADVMPFLAACGADRLLAEALCSAELLDDLSSNLCVFAPLRRPIFVELFFMAFPVILVKKTKNDIIHPVLPVCDFGVILSTIANIYN